MNTNRMLTRKLPTLQQVFFTQVLIICAIEALVHFLMPLVIPDANKALQSIADALLLSVIGAPFIWALIARPMRAAALSELHRTETMLKSIVDAVICFDAKGRVESLNPSAEKMFGWDAEEMMNRHVSRILPELVGVNWLAEAGQGDWALADHETVGRHRDGTFLPVLITVSKMNLDGSPFFAGIVHDMSESKRAAAELQEQKEFSLKLVLDCAVPCFVLDRDHKVLVWNKACEELTGIKSREVIGTDGQWKGFYHYRRRTLADVVLDGDDPTLYAGCMKSSFDQEGLQCEGWFDNVGGRERYLFFDAVQLRNGKGEVIAVMETVQDLTQRKRVEDSLKKSEEKFFKAYHASPDGIVINTKADGVFIEGNEAFFKMLGYAREEVIGHSSLELGLWADPRQRVQIVERSDREGVLRNVEIGVRVKSGALRTFLWSSDVIELNGRECFIAVLRDITAEKENESELIRSKNELTAQHEELSVLFSLVESAKREWEKTMDCINDVVILLDGAGRVKRCNRAAAELVGLSFGDITGTGWRQLLELAGLPAVGSVGHSYAYEFHHERSDKWLFLTYYRDCEAGDGEEAGAVVTIHDITGTKQAALELARAYTGLKETHAQMIQQEKMASIGQMAAGVAHEINNPTGFITSNLSTLGRYAERLCAFIAAQSESPPEPEAQEKLLALRKQLRIDRIIADVPSLIAESLDGAERIRKITSDLKCFCRSDAMEPSSVSLVECVERSLNIVWNELKYKTTLHRDYSELPPVTCHPQQLSQVFMNLLVNAGHAIEQQGDITIRTWQENGFACVAVTDTGCGIPEEIRRRIFEPFFTTKEAGKGTGLGLSISYDIVKKHRGDLTVESTPGIGTTFTVQLPYGS